MLYIQDIFNFYKTPNLLEELIPSLSNLYGLLIVCLLSLSFIMKSFLINYNTHYTERFCLGWSFFSFYFFCLNNIFGVNLSVLGYFYSFFLILTAIILYKKKLFFLNFKKKLKNNYELLLLLPIIFILTSSNIKEWDSFAFWQPTAVYLTENFEFPKSDFWHQKHPYSTVLIYFYSNFLGGGILENIPSLFNLIILILFYFSLKDYFLNNKLFYLPLLLLIFFNPILINSKTYTNYADNSLAFMLFVIINFLYRKNFFIENKKILISNFEILYLFSFVSLLTSIKSSGFIFFLIFLLSYLLVFFTPLINYLKKDLKIDKIILILSLFIPYILWRIYISDYFNGLNFFNHGFRIEILPITLNSIFIQILERKFFFINVFFLFVFYFYVKSIKIRNLLKIVLLIFVFYNLFLIISYLTHFSYGEAKSATSYWRYNFQLSYLILFCDIIILCNYQNKFSKLINKNLSIKKLIPISTILILLLSPFILIKKIRYDIFQPSLAIVKNRDRFFEEVQINANSKIFLISNNPQINKKIYSYYLNTQINYSKKVDYIKSVTFKDYADDNYNIKKFDFLIEYFDNKNMQDCYKFNDCLLIKIKNLNSLEEYKINYF